MTISNDETDSAFPKRDDPLVLVRAYWEALRQTGEIPFRTDINPRGIEQILSSTFLIERVAPGMARFRIAGMDFSDLMGMEVRGLPLSAVFVPDARAALTSKLEQVFHGPAILEMTLQASGGLLKPNLTSRMLVMPLRDARGQTNLALGCLALKGKIGRSPRRFAISDCQVSPLLRPVNRPARAPEKAPATGFAPRVISNDTPKEFAEPATDFKPHYLRLVE
ncbi:PAS domain-containing protein [Pseudorhodobacter sp. W20_MBD10_FR17]|uniref:PAS domain-containing protein n=1 Tax=Pseudorhodobacter sp. W20_MBD10_FR17 TaxID=3240266 RepID=UPI003F95D289